MTLTGNRQLKYELRLKTVKELISNWNVYDNEELSLYSAWDSFEIPKENASKRTESNKTKVFKRKERKERSKERKVNIR